MMEQIIEEYGIGVILLLVGATVIAVLEGLFLYG